MQHRGIAKMDIFFTSLYAPHFASAETAPQAVSTGAAAAERAAAASALSPWVYSVAAARKVGVNRGAWEQTSSVADAFAEIGVRGASRRSREAQVHAAASSSQVQGVPHADSSEMWLLEALQTRAAALVASSDPITIALRIQDELHSSADEGVLQAKLFDLLGGDALDLLTDLLQYRKELLPARARLQRMQKGEAPEMLSSGATGGGMVSSSSRKRADKNARKAKRRGGTGVGGDALAGLGFDEEYLATERSLGLQKGHAPTGGSAVGADGLARRDLATPASVGLMAAGAFLTQGGLPEGSEETSGPDWREVRVPAPKPLPQDESMLVPVTQLDDYAQVAFRGVKKLNRLQSKVFPTAYGSSENMLVCAPTGAGKTNVAMLAVCREIGQHFTHGVLQKDDFKIVYVAPMKALAAEVTAKFGQRLAGLGVSVKELTGDMQLTRREIERTQMLVTTPEKWDVMTRKGNEGSLVSTVRLLIIDEVHLLAEGRGAVIESLVARTLRQVESSQSMVRLVGLSATLPNYEDVALFLRVNPSTGLFHFGSTARPVPLAQRFIGISKRNAQERAELFSVKTWEAAKAALRRGKQVMVFVHSRKNTVRAANELRALAQDEGALGLLSPFSVAAAEVAEESEEGSSEAGGVKDIPATAPIQKGFSSLQVSVEKSRNSDLRALFRYGLGIHHAGMLRSDRTLSEALFARGAVKVLCCTATLAWGVNLPAHTVIIKGTQVYNPEAGGYTDLGVLDVQQIFGRAGRPQFDVEGEGIIITGHDKLPKYLGMLTNSIPIESSFIKALPDHLNAEVAAGTVTSVREAMVWLSYTYLYIRMLRNPQTYGIKWDEKASDPLLAGKRMELIHNAAKTLDEARMVRFDTKSGSLAPTDLGRVASHFYLQYGSIQGFNEKLGLDTPEGATSGAKERSHDMSDKAMLELVCSAQEFEQVRVRDEELSHLDALRDSAHIDVSGDVANSSGKTNMLLQAYISGVRVTAFTLVSDTAYVRQSAGRIARGLFEIALKKGWAGLAEQLLDLCKTIDRRTWWDAHPLKQIASVHPNSTLSNDILQKLENRGWSASVDQLRNMTANEAGALVGNTQVGRKILQQVHQLPFLHADVAVQPITRSILRVTATLTPDFDWNDRLHGTVQGYWIWVEDGESETIYHHEYHLLHKKAATPKSRGGKPEPAVLAFTIPIKEPLPPQYWLKVMSDSWVGVSTAWEVSFKHLVLPEQHPPHTPLMDLDPLPIAALNQPDYQALYPFTHFNPVQTQFFHVAYHTDHNMLVGAPTGSGKTIAAELAVMRMLEVHPGSKCVYVAPLRALVSERLKDWRKKFGPLGRKLVELTGDFTPDQKALAEADILVATPEKWDSISRGWQRRGYVQKIGLVIMDEIHLLGEDRGPVLEVIVSRMRYISANTEHKVRLIGLSTALANAKDLADWLGIDRVGLYNFRPSVRPIPMEAHIQGYPGKHYCPRMATMNKPAFAAIKMHSPNKPVLIFVSSRRQTRLTALELIALCAAEENSRLFLHMPEDDAIDIAATMKDAALQHTLAFGIGIHHAGLCERDRSTVEELFCSGKMQVLVCTSTLAWGVNFPAHLVIIKGTEYFDGKLSRYVDFPITDVLQMMGRAGRPQFDTHGVAVIMVHEPKKNFYRKFLYEPFPVESHLHDVLHDHINAEVASGTIGSVQDTMDYLTWTYFFRRLVQNPAFYQLNDTDPMAVKQHLQDLVCDTLSSLADAGCVELPADFDALVSRAAHGPAAVLADIPVAPTTLGSICSYYYLKHATVGTFSSRFEEEEEVLCGPLQAALPALTRLLCDAAEFDEVPVRHNEDQLNAQLAAVVPWQTATAAMSHEMDDPHVKAFLLLQAHMARLPLPIADYVNDTKSVLDQAARVLNAMVDIAADAGYLQIALRLMLMNQCIVQAQVPGSHTLLQIPHMNKAAISALQSRFGASAKVLGAARGFAAGRLAPEEAGAIGLGEVAAQRIVDVESTLSKAPGINRRTAQGLVQAIGAVPLLDVEFSVKFAGRETRIPLRGGQGGAGGARWEVPVFEGEEADDPDSFMDLKLRVKVSNPRQAKKAVPTARGGKPKEYGWWLAVGAGSSMLDDPSSEPEELLALKRVRIPFHGRWTEQKLRVPCPAVEGDVALNLHLVCDGISGTDQQFAIPLRAVPVAEFMPLAGGKQLGSKASPLPAAMPAAGAGGGDSEDEGASSEDEMGSDATALHWS